MVVPGPSTATLPFPDPCPFPLDIPIFILSDISSCTHPVIPIPGPSHHSPSPVPSYHSPSPDPGPFSNAHSVDTFTPLGLNPGDPVNVSTRCKPIFGGCGYQI